MAVYPHYWSKIEQSEWWWGAGVNVAMPILMDFKPLNWNSNVTLERIDMVMYNIDRIWPMMVPRIECKEYIYIDCVGIAYWKLTTREKLMPNAQCIC